MLSQANLHKQRGYAPNSLLSGKLTGPGAQKEERLSKKLPIAVHGQSVVVLHPICVSSVLPPVCISLLVSPPICVSFSVAETFQLY